MKVLQVHNHHQCRGGEEVMFEAISRILADKGHDVLTLERSNRDIHGLRGKMRAFTQGCYSNSAKNTISSVLDSERPDIVHVHNVYTLISPSVLVACRRFNVPVVIRCADFRFISCPIGNHLSNGAICERCVGGREFWCVLKNCRKSICESLAYTLRSAAARKWQLFKDNVTLYVPPSEFVRKRMINAGFPQKSIVVVPNTVSIHETARGEPHNKYVAYVGRISPEKGVDTLLKAAAKTQIPVKIAGDNSQMPELAKMTPSNARFAGLLGRDQLAEFYRNALFSVVPSTCFETFGLVAAEAMSYGLPVIASKIGALPEIVEDGVTGFLFDPGNADELAGRMRLLWENPSLCRKMGGAARDKVIREYGENLYYRRLLDIYNRAIDLNKSWGTEK